MKNNFKNILNDDDDTDFEYNSENDNFEDENSYIYEENIKNTICGLSIYRFFHIKLKARFILNILTKI